MKEQNRIASVVNSKFYPLLLFFVSFVFVTLFSRSTSFLYVFEGGDPAIFKQMGLAILKGKTIYVDYFDNKGCILYFIQAFGLWLGGDFFILLMQAISLTITLVIWDKMIALYRDEKDRFVCLSIALLLLLCFYDDGDMTEEWCLPFASYPLLVYFRYIKSNKETRPIDWFAIGICFGVISFIRVNNAVPFIGFVAYLFVVYLLRKDFKKFFWHLTSFVVGFAIIAGVCILYFYLKAGRLGVDEMVYASFVSNFEYLAVKGRRQIYIYIFYFSFLSLCVIQQIINSRNDKEILIPTLVSYALFVVTFGIRRCFTHYLMALLPLLVVLLMTIKIKKEKKSRTAFIVSLLVAALFYLPIPLALAVNDLILKNDKYSTIYNNFHHCIEDISIEERDSIFNYNLLGNGYGLLLHEGLIQSNKVCVSGLTTQMPYLWKITTNQKASPKWIMVSWERYYDKSDAYYIINNYDLYCEFPYERIYLNKPKIGQQFQVYLYRRKD